MKRFSYIVGMLVVLAGGARGESLRPAPVFSDGLVLQRGDAPVWGTAEPRSTVGARFLELPNQIHLTAADSTGAWRIQFTALPAGGPFTLEVATPAEKVLVKDVLIGDVWLCAGQSNMVMPLSDEAATSSADKWLRVLTVPRPVANFRQGGEGDDGRWRCADTDTSAVAALFGAKMRAQSKAPVGVIVCAHGPSRIAEWRSPGGLYAGMVRPVVGYALAGVVWYQGESNVRDGLAYGDALRGLIGEWRSAWKAEVPFFVVGLWGQGEPWDAIREAQRAALTLPGVKLVDSADLPDLTRAGDSRLFAVPLHPRNKTGIADRLSAATLSEEVAP